MLNAQVLIASPSLHTFLPLSTGLSAACKHLLLESLHFQLPQTHDNNGNSRVLELSKACSQGPWVALGSEARLQRSQRAHMGRGNPGRGARAYRVAELGSSRLRACGASGGRGGACGSQCFLPRCAGRGGPQVPGCPGSLGFPSTWLTVTSALHLLRVLVWVN